DAIIARWFDSLFNITWPKSRDFPWPLTPPHMLNSPDLSFWISSTFRQGRDSPDWTSPLVIRLDMSVLYSAGLLTSCDSCSPINDRKSTSLSVMTIIPPQMNRCYYLVSASPR